MLQIKLLFINRLNQTETAIYSLSLIYSLVSITVILLSYTTLSNILYFLKFIQQEISIFEIDTKAMRSKLVIVL